MVIDSGLFYGVLAGSMALVVIARDGVLFLIAWEAMAIAAFFAATAEDRKPRVRRAGWVYLIATHAGTLCLLAMFALWKHVTGSFALTRGADLAERDERNAVCAGVDRLRLQSGAVSAARVAARRARHAPVTFRPSCPASCSRWGSTAS